MNSLNPMGGKKHVTPRAQRRLTRNTDTFRRGDFPSRPSISEVAEGFAPGFAERRCLSDAPLFIKPVLRRVNPSASWPVRRPLDGPRDRRIHAAENPDISVLLRHDPSPQLPSPSSLSPGEREEGPGLSTSSLRTHRDTFSILKGTRFFPAEPWVVSDGPNRDGHAWVRDFPGAITGLPKFWFPSGERRRRVCRRWSAGLPAGRAFPPPRS